MQISLTDVSRSFGQSRALERLSLEIPSGSRVALVGPNGSGKSTLTRILMGMLTCEGEVRLDGQDPYLERQALAHRLAYVPQVPPAMGATVSELVEAIRLIRALDPTELSQMASRLQLELALLSDRSFRFLSGGMKQKLMLALAFCAPASLFILDEPTASLDTRARERFHALFRELPREATILLCSHRLEELSQLVDHVLVLEEGTRVFFGPVQEWQAWSHSTEPA